MFVQVGVDDQEVVRGLRDPNASDTDLLVTHIFTMFVTNDSGEHIVMQPYKINVMTLEKRDKLQGKYV